MLSLAFLVSLLSAPAVAPRVIHASPITIVGTSPAADAPMLCHPARALEQGSGSVRLCVVSK